MTEKTWKLVWQDYFEGDEIDPTKWHVEIGYTGASNKELQTYTDFSENIHLADSCLIFTALKKNYSGHEYTSARITTRGLHAWTYGKVEASIKIPTGQGIWPAFWMLGENVSSVGWPKCGEIDIMENIGSFPNTVRGTLHGPGYSRDDSIGADYYLPDQAFCNEFHLFAIEWEPREIRWYVDGYHFNTLTYKDVPGKWVFNLPFYIVLNLAVGGLWPGYPDRTTQFPQSMLIDYVRVFSHDLKDGNDIDQK